MSTMLSTAVTTNHLNSLATRILEAAAAIARRLRDRRLERKAIAALNGLDERALRDIGLSRSIIPFMARDGIAAGTASARRR